MRRLVPGPVIAVVLFLGLLFMPVSGDEGGAPAGEERERFPDSWAGKWGGELVVTGVGGKVHRVPSSLEIGPLPDSGDWRWALKYGDQPTREYRLLVESAEEGRFVIDEGNSIRLSARLIAGQLVSAFSVAGNRLTVTYRKEGDTIRLRMVIVSEAPAGTTGGEGQVPSVSHYAVKSLQEAVLRRAP